MTISFLVILGIIISLSFGLNDVRAQENNTQDFGISVETDEKLVENLAPILPYLGIIVAGIIVGIIVIIKKSSRDDDLEEEFEEGSETADSFMTHKFQDIRTGTDSDDENILDPEQIIQNKIQMISKLQENKIGDQGKLESIKKTLVEDGSFTKEDNEYLEEQLEEYNKNK